MLIDLELKNYRCFPDSSPARITVAPGFVALIGPNNSGKSTIIRALFELRPLLRQLQGAGSARYVAESQTPIDFAGVSDQQEVFADTNDRDISLRVAVRGAAPRGDLRLPEALIVTIPRASRAAHVAMIVQGERRKIGGFVTAGDGGAPIVPAQGGHAYLDPYFESFRILADSLYLGPFRNAINVAEGQDYYDISVGRQFIQRWDDFKSGRSSRANNRTAIRVEREIGRIFDLPGLQLNATSDNETLQVIVADQVYTLQEQGAGFAQFVLVLAFIATRSPALVLIDEPELNLHPTLQLDFLQTLASFATFGTVFASHSLGLARSAAERIYATRKVAEGKSVIRDFEDTPNLAELLGELSYSGYQELGYRTVLLVEGSTEIKTVQRLLRRHGVEHEVVLLPLGGSDMIKADAGVALGELRRLLSDADVSALIDSERTAADGSLDSSRQGFVEACTASGIRCHVLTRRALENYFPEHAIQSVKGPKYRALAPYEKLSDVQPSWAKSENWRIAGEMLDEDLAGTDLGEFLAEVAASATARRTAIATEPAEAT